MSGRRTLITKAKPVSIRFSEKDGYKLLVKINEGRQDLVDKTVTVILTADQLNAIADWDANKDIRLELDQSIITLNKKATE